MHSGGGTVTQQRPGAFITGVAGTALTGEERAFLAEADPLGFILFDRNVDSPEQLRRLTGTLRDALGRDAPVLIDQEGGRVARLRPPHWRDWPAPLDQVARAGPRAEQVMRLRYAIIAAELRAVGIDVNCAPCADVVRPDTHAVLRNRCYGDMPDTVSRIARAVAEGLLSGGVLPVLKHIPGHGAATADSHLELPRVDLPRDMLQKVDFAPFAALADLPVGMTAHVVYAAFDPDRPATTSPDMITLIRQDVGFTGLLMSDDISMGALNGGIADRCRAALAAGCDVILHSNGDLAEMRAVAAASGRMGERAVQRAEAALALRRPPEADLGALVAEWDTLMRAETADG